GVVGHESGTFIDLPGNSSYALDNTTGQLVAEAFINQSNILSVLESTTIHQSQDIEAASSIGLIDRLNQAGETFYDFNQNSSSTLASTLSANGWSSGDITSLTNAVSDGTQRWILNQSPSTALGEWTGYSNIVMRYSQGQINSIGHLIGTLKGGYSSVSQPSTQVNTGTSNYNQSSPIENTNGQMSAD